MSTPTPVSGFVLAGGASRRMGRDKATLDWHGRPLFEHMTDLLRAVCDRVSLVGRQDLPDDVSGLGPIGGIATALRHSTTTRNIVLAIDLPLLTEEFIKYFAGFYLRSNRPVCACRIADRFPLCLGIDGSMLPVVDDYIGQGGRSIHGVLLANEPALIAEERLRMDGFSSEIFTNVNSEDDYRSLNRDNS